jgi:hypothetical protein
MLLSCRFLDNVCGANSFEYRPQLRFSEGDGPEIYIQLIDATLDRSEAGFNPGGRRYVPPTGAILQVTLDNINSANVVTRVATQPFPGDASIWKIQLLPTDKVVGTVALRLALTANGKTVSGKVMNALLVTPSSNL